MGNRRFWSDHSIEPKRKFRWIMGFNGIPYWLLKKASRPTVTVTEAEHVFLNYKFFFPGRVEYDEMSVTIADPLHPDASKTMMKLLTDSGYITPDAINLQSPKTMTKKAAVQSVGGKLFMAQLDAEGEVVEEWAFWNPWIKSVNFDEADYESDDLINLEVTFRYDWATVSGIGDVSVGKLGKNPGFSPGFVDGKIKNSGVSHARSKEKGLKKR
jgi:hypothetical protein